MSDYARIKKLDEESLQKLTEGAGPADECLCSLLSPPEGKSFARSVKKMIGALSRRKQKEWKVGGGGVDIPLAFTADGAGIQSSKELVRRQRACGRCGCDEQQLVLKHSYANIRITSPDLSSVCPCPSDCLPDKEKLQNNIKVIVENAQLDSNPNFEK